MRVAGIAVEMVQSKRSMLRLCILDDGVGSPTITAAEEIAADDVDIVEQLFAVARGVESRLKGLGVDRVIVRRGVDAIPRLTWFNGRVGVEQMLKPGVEPAEGIHIDAIVWDGPRTRELELNDD